jgi:hypothetical protein
MMRNAQQPPHTANEEKWNYRVCLTGDASDTRRICSPIQSKIGRDFLHQFKQACLSSGEAQKKKKKDSITTNKRKGS